MRIVFISNYFSHHQKEFSEEINRLTDGGYTFIETVPMTAERQKLGWGKKQQPEYVKCCYDLKEAYEVINHADAVIAGSAPEKLVQYAIRKNKPVFRCHERPLKNGAEPLKYLPRLIKWHLQNPFYKPIYLLCASAYTAKDYKKFGMFRNRMFCWGYFPETKHYPDLSGLFEKKDKSKILWVGRLIDWKHPEMVLEAAKELKRSGESFYIEVIGTGPLENTLKQQVISLGLGEQIRFLGSMSPESVREHMEQAGICLCTSDRKEGWGAVVNEAMNSGCAVIASKEMGAVPFLMKDQQNGLIYSAADSKVFCENVRYLLNNTKLQEKLGHAAYETIQKEWNGKEAAKRLLHLMEQLSKEKKIRELYQSGPCSSCR